jgi:hypothetical protein
MPPSLLTGNASNQSLAAGVGLFAAVVLSTSFISGQIVSECSAAADRRWVAGRSGDA